MSSHKMKNVTRGLGFLTMIGIVLLPFLSNGVFFWHGHLILDTILFAIEIIIAGLMLFLPNFRKFVVGNQGLLMSDVAVLLFTLLYIISIFYAASTNLAVQGALDAVALLVPYFLLRFNSLRKLFGPWIGAGFVLASIPIVVIGLANGWGQLLYPSATELTPQHQLQIASVFQYHNAFAAFTASVATGLLAWVARATNTWLRAIAVGLASLNIAGLILSGSRGALALWLVVMVLVLIGLRSIEKDGQIVRNRFMASSYLSIVSGVLGYALAQHANNTQSPVYGWIGIILAIAIPIICFFVQNLIYKENTFLNGNKGLYFWIGLGFVIGLAGAIFKSHALISKLESYHIHQLSVVQRFIFWKDGLKIFMRNPVSGLGAGAWQAMYQKVQSYPYFSAKVHSFGIDVLMEVGILGFFALVTFVWPVLRTTIWPRRAQLGKISPLGSAFIAAGLVLFIHSLMDWDMSFEFLMFFFFAAVGAAASSGMPLKMDIITHKHTSLLVAPLGLLAVASILISSLGLRAEAYSQQAQFSGVKNASKLYMVAYHLAPYDDAYLTSAATSLLQEDTSRVSELQTESMVQHAERLNPYSPSIASGFAQLSYRLGNYDVTFHQAMLAMNNAPYDPSTVSLALTSGTVDGLRKAESNPASAKSDFEQVVKLYNIALERKKIVSQLPSYLPPSKPYQLDSFSLASVSAAKFVLGDLSGADELANVLLQVPDQHTKEVAKLIILMINNPNQVHSYLASTPSVESSYKLLYAASKIVR